MHKNTAPFAEVIESSLQGFLAQSWKWDKFPTFGSLVAIEATGRMLYGIVHQIQTGSMDPVRYPFPYQKTQEELMAEQPQIFEFLKTTFSCLIIGYTQEGKIYYQFAPEPPKIHAFVAPASLERTKEFFAHDRYLYPLFNLSGQILNLDELLLAHIKTLADAHMLTQKFLERFIEAFSLHTGNDYRRLKLFMHRAQPLIQL